MTPDPDEIMAPADIMDQRSGVAVVSDEPGRQPAYARFRVHGQCQGVGYRPFVYRLARSLSVRGSVWNDPSGVVVEAWAPEHTLAELEMRLRTGAPSLALVDRVERERVKPPLESSGPSAFTIAASDADPAERGRVTVDASVCPDCLRDLTDPENRRYRHPLLNCTNCGPRYTIIQDLPYDRPLTTMADFPMCPRCAEEYADPGDRRFHAQPTCCPDCGPSVRLVDGGGQALSEYADPFVGSAAILAKGGILAMKGLGGFHLVADATSREAVACLRRRKQRDYKPFAVMVPDLGTARTLCDLSPKAQETLASPTSPIVIAPWRPEGVAAFGLAVDDVAPGQHRLGVMLPNTPMQHLLAAEIHAPLVMTSANISDDPLVQDDDELPRLDGLADAILTHDRAIERAVDDSVAVDVPGRRPVPLRRARGYVPAPVALPTSAPGPGLCLGADLKNSVAVVRGDVAMVSQHMGDLNHVLAHRRFTRTLDDLQRLFDLKPEWVAVDLHPRYLSRQHGIRLASDGALTVVEVQHHHAHLASLLAEHQRNGPIVGLVCDGVGLGTDGTAWGGEVLFGGTADFQRVGRMRPLLLPGGDVAARRIGRAALSWMTDALGPDTTAVHPLAARVLPDARERKGVEGMLRTGLACPPSSGLGRLFDATASLLGICDFNHHEGFAAQLLESEASRSTTRPDGSDVMRIDDREMLEIDTRPLLRALLVGRDSGWSTPDLAWFFHDAVADGLARAAILTVTHEGSTTVGLTGGCFCNVLLTSLVAARLERAGLEVLLHRLVPPNDGGIALGQAAVAAARLHRDRES